eukprot:TRINITY_DN8148_c0_g1_i1.p1 TRINITY_DN8148_c0_g1~~TRINITY_DN8148_c0_g1_i1.p1  ORF type:complete len:433 (-),score=81.83 TRINITY_DN8148_c0_g1_i1:32-1330(-)
MYLFTIGLAVVLVSIYLSQRLPTPQPAVVGIDLGTSFSSAAIFINGKGTVELIPDHLNGDYAIPSVVAVTENGDFLTGQEALFQSSTNPKRTIYHLKRFIGKQYLDKDLQRNKARYPFEVINVDGYPYFHVETRTGSHSYSAGDLSKLLLSRIKKSVEIYLKKPLKKVVLAVPVEFDDQQKNATRDIAMQLGMEVLRIIYEPTAAAMAFGLHNKNIFQTILVFDFGGGTLDVSVLSVSSGVFEVLAISGDEHLGGEDFTSSLVNHFLSEQFSLKYNKDLTDDTEFIQLLRYHVERAKIKLSDSESSLIEFKHGESFLFSEILTRESFQLIASDLFQRILEPVRKALDDASIEASKIDDVVLVGGASRMPLVHVLLQNFFGKVPNTIVDPQQAVAIGTALQAAISAEMWPLQVAAREKPKVNVTKSYVERKIG